MAISPSQPAPGLAEFQSDTITGLVELFHGDTPAPMTESVNYTTGQAAAGIPANTPVFVDDATKTIALVDGTTVTKANAITVGVLRAGAGGGVAGKMGVYRAGNFNINALNWPASLDTEAERLGTAFDKASCQIYVGKPFYS